MWKRFIWTTEKKLRKPCAVTRMCADERIFQERRKECDCTILRIITRLIEHGDCNIKLAVWIVGRKCDRLRKCCLSLCKFELPHESSADVESVNIFSRHRQLSRRRIIAPRKCKENRATAKRA